MNKEFLRKFACWAPLHPSMCFTHEQYKQGMKELLEIAKEYPEVMDK